ncbi:MAG: hypothetical protein OQJ89_09535 [Kangiellaceae bacterium]|nr:hypothetical protein [Kangiellaceae bacterium]MCW8997214.1 hypothetical protein [Kangiellaceae bacterium]MCW9017195.1 hypothetical protein [Kangiellaceae bacterium]
MAWFLILPLAYIWYRSIQKKNARKFKLHAIQKEIEAREKVKLEKGENSKNTVDNRLRKFKSKISKDKNNQH